MQLALNSRGTDVKLVQEKLNTLGYDVGTPDGIFGKKTERAVITLQNEIKLAPSGVVGPWLYDYLMKVSNKPMNKNKTVVITAGHSNTDPGAVNGQRTESKIAIEIRNIVTGILKDKGFTVLNDGTDNTNKSLNEAVKLIPKSDLAIEIHLNAAANKTAGGVEALAKDRDKAFCKTLCSNVSEVLGNKVRGSDGGWKAENSGQHTRLAFVSAGGIILETFFISNDKELATYDNNKLILCQAIVAAIIKHI